MCHHHNSNVLKLWTIVHLAKDKCLFTFLIYFSLYLNFVYRGRSQNAIPVTMTVND